MRHSQFRVRGRARMDDESRVQPSASDEASGGRRASEFHLSSLLDALRLDEVVQQAPEAIAILTPEEHIVLISNEFARLFGYERHEVQDRPIEDLIVPERLRDSARQHADQVARGQRVEVETVRRRKDGTVVHVFLVAVPLKTVSGEHVVSYVVYH